MDAAWQTSIDRTLRTTEATLEHLQERRRTYDRAKTRVDDYLGGLGTTPHRDVRGLDSLDRTDLGVPPPLPQHRRYRATHDGSYESAGLYSGTTNASPTAAAVNSTAGPSPSFYLTSGNAPPPATTTATSTNTNGRRGISPASRDDPTAPLQLVNAQVRGAMLELELEKAKRADSIRELAYRTTAELGELRSMITQLQGENATLRKSVRALESRLGFAPEKSGTPVPANGNVTFTSFSELTPSPHQQQQQQPSKSALLASAVANSGFGLHQDGAGGTSASLLRRVEALESGLARQQQLTEDRQTRTAAALREMVKVEVEADMAEVRTLAREAARGSAEELLKLRLSSVESTVQSEVQRALRAAASSESAAQHAQQQCEQTERRLSAQVQKLHLQMLDVQQGAGSGSPLASPGANSSGLGPGAAFASQAGQERLLHLERSTEEELQKLRGALRQLRQDTEAQLERVAQEQKQTSLQLQSRATAADVRQAVDRLAEEQQQQQQRASSSASGSAAFREQVHAVLRPQLQPLQDALQQLEETTQARHDTAEAWRRQAGLRFAAMEASTKDFREEVERLEQQGGGTAQELRQVRAEAAGAQTRLLEQLRQCKAELTEGCEARVQASEERLQLMQRDRQQQSESQLRQLQQVVAEQHDAAQRARLSGEAQEERLRRVEGAVAAMESSVPHAVADVKAKCEAMQNALQQSCAAPLSRVQQDVEALQRRLHAADEDKTRMSALWGQQLADAKLFFEEHVRNSRDMLEQRLAHQKELYEELRSQQSSQRRYAEEQQQQMLEQLKRVQQQQQQLVLTTPAPLPAPAAVVTAAPPTTARSVSETPSSAGVAANDEATNTATITPTSAAHGAPTVSAEAFLTLQQQVQQALLPQLQSVEKRVEAAEQAALHASASIATTAATALTVEAIAPLQRRLEELHEQTQLDRKEQQLHLSEVEHALADKARVLHEACEHTSADTTEQLSRLRNDLTSALAPLHLATSLSLDVAAMQHLAQGLQEHLTTPRSVAHTLDDVTAQLAQHAQAVDALRSTIDETQLQMVNLRAEAEAQRSTAASPPRPPSPEATTAAGADVGASQSASAQDVAEVRVELQSALQELHEKHDALMERHAALAQQTRSLSEEKLAELAGALEGVRQATEPLPQQLEHLSEQYAALQAAQRQQLPTLQKYVQEVLDVVQTSQAASLDPVQLRLRSVEDRHRQLQSSLEEWMTAQAATAEEAARQQQKRGEQLRRDWERVEAAHASLTALQEQVRALEAQRGQAEAAQRQLQEDVRAVAAKAVVAPPVQDSLPSTAAAAVEPEENKEAAAAVTVSAEPTPNADGVAHASVAQLQLHVEELDSRLSQLEEQTNDSLAVTADALGAFGQQLHDVVARFAVAVHGGAEETEAATGAARSSAASSSSAALVPASGAAPIANLEDVFTYFLRQLQQLQQALYQLQANTVETLEILEQHEESAAALPMLQHTVDAIAEALVPLAERLGVDATSFSLQLNSPHHHGNVYPASRDSSDSSLDDVPHDESSK